LADATFSTISLVPEKFEAQRCVGAKPCGRTVVPGQNQSFAVEGIFNAAQPAGNSGRSWKRRRRELGSGAYDPKSHLMIVNTNRLVAWVKLIPRDKFDEETNKNSG